MKNQSSNLLFILLLLTLATSTSLAQHVHDHSVTRCANTVADSLRLARNPSLRNQRQQSEQLIADYIRERKQLRTKADEVIIIPVVVHVVHNRTDQSMGGAGNANISDEQVASQIEVLNEDYGNTSGFQGFYTDSLGVDTGIRFQLVTVTRNFYTAKTQFSPLTDGDLLAEIAPAWSTNRYLNIWVCRLNDRYLGSSQFPVVTDLTDQTNGLRTTENETDALTDGVIIDYRYFGKNSPAITTAIYNLGRTTTHEVGHWLGLIHIWGDRDCGTDYCDDTPTAFTKNETTDLTCSPVFSVCGPQPTRNMIENYMDYSPDACMSIFTNDQKERMRAVLELSPRRAKLVEFSKLTGDDLIVDVFPNPVSETLYSNIFTPNFQPFSVAVYNQKGQQVIGETVNRTSLNVSNFPSGIYYYKVNSADKTLTKRFFVR